MRRTTDAACTVEFLRRAERARELRDRSLVASEALAFAEGLCRVQGRCTEVFAGAHAFAGLSGNLARDVERVLAGSENVLRYVAERGPDGLASSARTRLAEGPSKAHARMLAYWTGEGAAREGYLTRSQLRPYVEFLREAGVVPERERDPKGCPLCGGSPSIAVRRDGPASEGAVRLLACSLCGGEWPVGRILCPSCSEQDPRALPVFSSDVYPGVRIETCDTCHRYVKSIDLSVDARAQPEIDDLASLTLDLWARGRGLERIEVGLAAF